MLCVHSKEKKAKCDNDNNNNFVYIWAIAYLFRVIDFYEDVSINPKLNKGVFGSVAAFFRKEEKGLYLRSSLSFVIANTTSTVPY